MNCFDGHNDVLYRLHKAHGNAAAGAAAFIAGEPPAAKARGHLDLPRMQQASFCGGLFAVFVAPLSGSGLNFSAMASGGYRMDLPPPLALEDAQPIAMQQIELLHEIERQTEGALRICRNPAALRTCIEAGAVAAVLHMEGVEAIATDLANLDALFAAGLRSLGPVWSRPNAFGHGVPFQFPGSPDTGPGLTAAGKSLLRRCNELGVMVDLSHLNEKGFRDVAALSQQPLVATHSNAWALCPSTRNLTDEQLAMIRDSDGMVGVNFGTCFLREDGAMNAQTPIHTIVQQLDYLMQHVGEQRVGFGSDFDGAIIPAEMGDVTGLAKVQAAMQQHGYSNELQQRLCHGNWMDFLQRQLPL